MDGRQISIRRAAAIALAVWLALVVIVAIWWRPRFWEEPYERFQRAQMLQERGRTAEALGAVDTALDVEPRNTGYLVFKGYRLLELNRHEEAEQTFRRALAEDPSRIDASLGLAAALARSKARSAALQVLQALPTAALSEAELRRRSQLYGALDAHAPALDDLAHLLHLRPDDPALLREAALQARMMKDWPQAATLALRLESTTIDPRTRQWAAVTRAEALEAAGRPTEPLAAAEHYEELVRLRPDEAYLRRSLAFALRAAGRTAEAEHLFRQLIDDGAADRHTRIAYAWMLNTQRRYTEAWNVLDTLPQPDPDPDVLELQARTALWAGRAHDAAQLVSALVAVRPHRAELWKRLAEGWQAIGEQRQAAVALATYVRLESHDADARQQLADMLAAAGSLDSAIEEYRALVAMERTNPALLRRLGLLEETAGHLAAARAAYVEAVGLPGHDPSDLYLRLARIHRWMSEPIHAVAWYEKHIASQRDNVLRQQAESESALALLESGDAERSLARLIAAASNRPLDAGELLVAARAAEGAGQRASAARYLLALAEQRPLTIQEETWLAGLYRATGRPAEALSTYEKVAARTPQPTAEVLEAIADLRFDQGDFAGSLAALDRIPDLPKIWIKRARANVRLGRSAEARSAYAQYLRLHREDAVVRLEAARHDAGTGSPLTAIEHYMAVMSAVGPAGLQLELARAYLAAGRYAEAEQWARQAVATGRDTEEARLALAQSLHLQGRVRQAEAVLASLTMGSNIRGEALVWRSRVATALDQQLDAYRSAQRALEAGAQPREQLLLWMAAAARRRGDYGRARAAMSGLSSQVAPAEEVVVARRELNAVTAPTVGFPLWFHADSNDVRIIDAAARVVFFVPSRAAAISIGASAGEVSQRSFSSGRTTAAVTVDHIFPIPELELMLGAGYERYDRAPDLFNWRAQGTYYRGDGSFAGLSFAREALLPLMSGTLRQFNRVLDVAALGPGFHLHALRGHLDMSAPGPRRLRIDAGVDALEDGNRRVSSYLHYQIPIATDAGRWIAIRPNLYFEAFRDTRTAYFSPRRHLTTGMMLHGIRQSPTWRIELELNPQWLRTSGANGFGMHGVLSGTATIGRVSLGAGAFVFYDSLEDYLQRRLSGVITIPVGRR